MNNYEVFSGNGTHFEKAHLQAITSYKEATAIAKREMAKPDIIEAAIFKNDNPIEYYGPKGHSYL